MELSRSGPRSWNITTSALSNNVPLHHILPHDLYAQAVQQTTYSHSSSPAAIIINDSFARQCEKLLPANNNSVMKCEHQDLPSTPPATAQAPFTESTGLNSGSTDDIDITEMMIDHGNGQFSWASEKYHQTLKKRKFTGGGNAPKPYDPKVPRPPNAFIIYHRTKSKELAKVKTARSPSDERHPSKTVAEMWREESEETKLKYQREADKALVEHKKKYPYYKYKPQKKDTKSKGKSREANGWSKDSGSKPKNQVTFEHRQQASMESAFTVFDLTTLEPEKESLNKSKKVSQDSTLVATTAASPAGSGQKGPDSNPSTPNKSSRISSDINATDDITISNHIVNPSHPSSEAPGLPNPNVNNLYDSSAEEIGHFSYDYTPLQSPEVNEPQHITLNYSSMILGEQTGVAPSSCTDYASPLPSPVEQRSFFPYQDATVSNMVQQQDSDPLVENLVWGHLLNSNFNDSASSLVQENPPTSSFPFDQDIKPSLGILTSATLDQSHTLLTPVLEAMDFDPHFTQSLGNASEHANIQTNADLVNIPLLDLNDNNNWLSVGIDDHVQSITQTTSGPPPTPTTPLHLCSPWTSQLEPIRETESEMTDLERLQSAHRHYLQQVQETHRQILRLQRAQMTQETQLLQAAQHQPMYDVQVQQIHQAAQQSQHSSPPDIVNINAVGENFQTNYF